MITNVCPRCHCEKLNLERAPFYGCAECGKAGKSYELHLKIQIDGDPEIYYVRNVMREMAGTLSEYTAPQLALGLIKVLEIYKSAATPTVAREIISRVVSESFHTMYQMAVPFLPPEVQEDVQILANLAMREQEAAQRKETDERAGVHEERDNGTGSEGSGGEAG